MTTIGWLLILVALIIARSAVKGRALNIAEDLSDFFKALLSGDQESLSEVVGRSGAAATFSEVGGAVGVHTGDAAKKGAEVIGGGTKPPVGFRNQIAWINSKGFNFNPSKGQTDGGGHAKNSYHYKGEAVDLSGDAATMLRAAKTIEAAFGPRITELIHTPLGYSIKHGKKVPPIDAAAHYNHVHWAEDPRDANKGGS